VRPGGGRGKRASRGAPNILRRGVASSVLTMAAATSEEKKGGKKRKKNAGLHGGPPYINTKGGRRGPALRSPASIFLKIRSFPLSEESTEKREGKRKGG